MSELTTFAGAENHALRILVLDGIRDFEVQVRNDPRMMDHIADSSMSLEDYRAMHDRIATKLLNNEEFDHRLFDGDETQFVVALAEDGVGTTSYQNNDAGQAARMRDEQIIEKAKVMDQDRRTTDSTPAPAPTAPPLSERTYNRVTLAAAGHHLETGDWDAHRKLAQIAVKSGYAAEVTQEYFNDAGTDTPLEHKIEIFDPGEAAPCATPGLRIGCPAWSRVHEGERGQDSVTVPARSCPRRSHTHGRRAAFARSSPYPRSEPPCPRPMWGRGPECSCRGS